MNDFVVVGAGVVGLSLAYELSRRGHRVCVLDQGNAGKEASWAGAGILPPANRETAVDPLDQLRALSHELHAEWAVRLREETGIDNGYRRCGGIYLARTAGETAALQGLAATYAEMGIAMQRLSADELARLEPALVAAFESRRVRVAYWLPDEAQLRNPRHLQALARACQARGVVLHESAACASIEMRGNEIVGVHTPAGLIRGDAYCLAAGAWTYGLLHDLGMETGILPIRGQIVLFRCRQPPFHCVLNDGPRYLVPREDGHVLIGSTEEEVGFDKSTTDEAISELASLGRELIPDLATAPIEKTWAGLRPGTFDGLPYLGRVPRFPNLFVAAGHFRSGLHMSPGTAVVMADLMEGSQPDIDLSLFRVGRG